MPPEPREAAYELIRLDLDSADSLQEGPASFVAIHAKWIGSMVFW